MFLKKKELFLESLHVEVTTELPLCVLLGCYVSFLFYYSLVMNIYEF